MRRICTGRTVLLIAHRLSTLRGADRIVTIEKGQMVEDGTHDSLLRAGGRYAPLWRLQTVSSASLRTVRSRQVAGGVLGRRCFTRRVIGGFDRRDEREFLPAALEVVETPASPTGRGCSA